MKTLALILSLVLFPLTASAQVSWEGTINNGSIEARHLSPLIPVSTFENDAHYITEGNQTFHMVEGVRSFDWYNPAVGIQPIPPYPYAIDVYKVTVRVYGGTYLTGCLMKCDGVGKNCVNLYAPTRYNNTTEVEVTSFTDGHIPADVWWAWNTTAKSGTVRVGGAIYFNETVE